MYGADDRTYLPAANTIYNIYIYYYIYTHACYCYYYYNIILLLLSIPRCYCILYLYMLTTVRYFRRRRPIYQIHETRLVKQYYFIITIFLCRRVGVADCRHYYTTSLKLSETLYYCPYR